MNHDTCPFLACSAEPCIPDVLSLRSAPTDCPVLFRPLSTVHTCPNKHHFGIVCIHHYAATRYIHINNTDRTNRAMSSFYLPNSPFTLSVIVSLPSAFLFSLSLACSSHSA